MSFLSERWGFHPTPLPMLGIGAFFGLLPLIFSSPLFYFFRSWLLMLVIQLAFVFLSAGNLSSFLHHLFFLHQLLINISGQVGIFLGTVLSSFPTSLPESFYTCSTTQSLSLTPSPIPFSSISCCLTSCSPLLQLWECQEVIPGRISRRFPSLCASLCNFFSWGLSVYFISRFCQKSGCFGKRRRECLVKFVK